MPHFEPDAHFHRVVLPAPGDRAALESLVGELSSQPLDHDRPLWEAYLIDGYRDGAALLVRIPHAVADGIALARVMLSLTDGAMRHGLVGPGPSRRGWGDGPALVTHAAAIGRAAAGAGTAAAGTALAAVGEPGLVRDAGARGLRGARASAKLLLPGVEHTGALKPGPGVAHRVAWSTPYDRWRVKRSAGRST